nr:hypothetical protein [Clostridia bacterium]
MWKTYCAAVLLSFTLALTACTAAVPALPYDTVRAAAVEYGCRGMLITPQSGDNALRLAERAVGVAVDNAQDWCLFLPYGPQDSPDKPEFGVIAVDDDAD